MLASSLCDWLDVLIGDAFVAGPLDDDGTDTSIPDGSRGGEPWSPHARTLNEIRGLSATLSQVDPGVAKPILVWWGSARRLASRFGSWINGPIGRLASEDWDII
jgi:hypothetical protein